MGKMASQISSLTIVYSTVYSGAAQRKHQSSVSLAFVWGIHRDWWIPRTKTSYAEMFPFDDVIMKQVGFLPSIIPPQGCGIVWSIYFFEGNDRKISILYCILYRLKTKHCCNVITNAMTSQITSMSIVCSTVCSSADQWKLRHWPLWGESTGHWWIPFTSQ